MELEGTMALLETLLNVLYRFSILVWLKVIDEHIRITTKQSNCNRIDIPSNLKVSYRCKQENKRSSSGNTFDGTKLDIFGIDLEKTAPIFVYFSGGYWQVCCIVWCTSMILITLVK